MFNELYGRCLENNINIHYRGIKVNENIKDNVFIEKIILNKIKNLEVNENLRFIFFIPFIKNEQNYFSFFVGLKNTKLCNDFILFSEQEIFEKYRFSLKHNFFLYDDFEKNSKNQSIVTKFYAYNLEEEDDEFNEFFIDTTNSLLMNLEFNIKCGFFNTKNKSNFNIF